MHWIGLDWIVNWVCLCFIHSRIYLILCKHGCNVVGISNQYQNDQIWFLCVSVYIVRKWQICLYHVHFCGDERRTGKPFWAISYIFSCKFTCDSIKTTHICTFFLSSISLYLFKILFYDPLYGFYTVIFVPFLSFFLSFFLAFVAVMA